MEKYSPNGNTIPISATEALTYVKTLLSEYDEALKNSNNEEIESNPYTDKIIMPLVSGKFVEIPEAIQTNAINEWLSEKKSNKSNKFIKSSMIDLDDDETDEPNETNTSMSNFNLLLVILIILILGGLYYMSTNQNK